MASLRQQSYLFICPSMTNFTSHSSSCRLHCISLLLSTVSILIIKILKEVKINKTMNHGAVLTLFLPHLQRPISINANSRRALQLKQRLLFFCVGRDGELSRLVLELPPAVGVLQSPASSCLTTYTPHNLEISPTGITVYILL